MTWGKRREDAAATLGGACATTAVARLGHRALAATLAALLTVTLLPALPATEGTAPHTAEALTGTTDYTKTFDTTNMYGTPGKIDGSTLRVASTANRSYYSRYPGSNIWGSVAGFVSKQKVSLKHNWRISFTGKVPSIPSSSSTLNYTAAFFGAGFIRTRAFTSTTGYIWRYLREWRPETGLSQAKLDLGELVNGQVPGTPTNTTTAPWGNQRMSFSYDARTDKTALTVGTATVNVPGARTTFGDSAYLFFLGGIEWQPISDPSQPSAPSNMQVEATFDSMTLPNLDPEISDITLYRYNDATDAYDILVGEDDVLERDEVVQARCTIRNRNTAASAGGYSEQFGMHLKLADTEANPTRGIEPFADSTHPLQVNGSTVATAAGPNTLSGANGVPITLTGS